MYRWLRDNGLSEPGNDSKGAGKRCTLALQDVRRRSQNNEEDR
jgi:hypothetical protein